MRKKENLLYMIIFFVVYKGDGIINDRKSITYCLKKNNIVT